MFKHPHGSGSSEPQHTNLANIIDGQNPSGEHAEAQHVAARPARPRPGAPMQRRHEKEHFYQRTDAKVAAGAVALLLTAAGVYGTTHHSDQASEKRKVAQAIANTHEEDTILTIANRLHSEGYPVASNNSTSDPTGYHAVLNGKNYDIFANNMQSPTSTLAFKIDTNGITDWPEFDGTGSDTKAISNLNAADSQTKQSFTPETCAIEDPLTTPEKFLAFVASAHTSEVVPC
jgi:hypothetical protein